MEVANFCAAMDTLIDQDGPDGEQGNHMYTFRRQHFMSTLWHFQDICETRRLQVFVPLIHLVYISWNFLSIFVLVICYPSIIFNDHKEPLMANTLKRPHEAKLYPTLVINCHRACRRCNNLYYRLELQLTLLSSVTALDTWIPKLTLVSLGTVSDTLIATNIAQSWHSFRHMNYD